MNQINQTGAIRNGFHSIEQVTDTYLKNGIRESGKTYLVRSDFSKMTKGLSVKSDSILTVYFYPIVRKDGNSNVIVKTIEKERDTYVDGIYEIRYVDRNNPSY